MVNVTVSTGSTFRQGSLVYAAGETVDVSPVDAAFGRFYGVFDL